MPEALFAHLLTRDGAEHIVVFINEAQQLALSTLNILMLLLLRERH